MGLGDEIMAVGDAERIWESNGRRRKVAIGPRREQLVHSPMERYCPWVIQEGEDPYGSILLRNFPGHRPYLTERQPAERQVIDLDYRPTAGRLFFSPAEELAAQRAAPGAAGSLVFDPLTKGSFIHGPNKEWPWEHWEALVGLLTEAGWTRIIQVGPAATPTVRGAVRVVTETARQALAIMAVATAVVVTEGLMHHATAAMGVRSVCLWGDRTDPKLLGYKGQIDIVGILHTSLPTGNYCGATVPCDHCIRSMASITPASVMRRIL